MYICICGQVTDSEIQTAVGQGKCRSLDELTDKLGVAACCGACEEAACILLEESLQRQQQLSANRITDQSLNSITQK